MAVGEPGEQGNRPFQKTNRGKSVKIYTKTGDRGRTGLFSGERVGKADARVEAYGAVDELNSVLGVLAASLAGDFTAEVAGVERIQSDLFRIGGWFATTPDTTAFDDLPGLDPEAMGWMEAEIDRMGSELPPLRGFVLPGGHPTAAWAHLARTVCRRAERQGVAFLEGVEPGLAEESFSLAMTYLNRLSDYLFMLARYLNHISGMGDKLWEPEAK
jgi:cob(I)alamin adenosyltransferase